MGWTYTDLNRNRTTLDKVKKEHVRRATDYGNGVEARIIMHEWHPKTWFALIRLIFPKGHERHGKDDIFLRVDLIDQSVGSFGYKDQTEEMGPYNEDKPSGAMAKAIFKYIPVPNGYAKEWRERNGVSFLNPAQPDSLG